MESTFTRDQVLEATLKYFNGDELAANVWIDKYCIKDGDIFYELTPADMHRRLAKEFARIEAKYPNPMTEDEIFGLLEGFRFVIPQGSPMAGIGNPFAITSISNCFVVGGQPDSYGGIMNLDEEGAQLMKRRGGVGNTMEFIRPSGALANGTPLGPNAGLPLYMERYSNTTNEVQQDGRRGARMLSIHIKHPDSEKFIDKKMTEGKVTGANVSVKVTNDFVEACNKGEDFYQIFPVEYTIANVANNIDLDSLKYDELYSGIKIDGIQTYYKKINPRRIQDKLVYNAWKSAEPGSLFWDKIINESPAKGYGEVWKEISTNPCGEIPLPAYDSCRLLVLNLMGFVFNAFGDNASLYDELLVNTTKKAQRLMDDVVDIEIEKIHAIIASIKAKKFEERFQRVELELWYKILDMAIEGRRTGLGITAEGDLIAAIGYKYGTPEASLFSAKLHQLIATASYESSIELAEERGAFPIWNFAKDEESDFIKRMFSTDNELMTDELFDRYKRLGRRNIANLTVAPTGSVSILSQTTSGIEPLFAAYYFRKKKRTNEDHFDYVDEMGQEWVEFPVFHRPFAQWYGAINDLTTNDAIKVLETCTKDMLDKLFLVSPYYLATAQDVDYIEKVRMQGAVQEWVDHSISVTVNMPENVTVDTVAEIYKVAHESGCKGITVYRDNSRGNVLSTVSVKDKKEEFEYASAIKRPDFLDCDIWYKTKAGENYFMLVGVINGKPYEIFSIIDLGEVHIPKRMKKGSIRKNGKGVYDLINSNGEIVVKDITSHIIESEKNSTRNFSAMLRHRMDPAFICDMISKYASVSSFHKVVGSVLRNYIKEEIGKGTTCPKEGCEGEMQYTEGCLKCPACGYAHCG
jgi:ribonucleoside-diphosphate reductase alpha chain